jgi:hypothetical protein
MERGEEHDAPSLPCFARECAATPQTWGLLLKKKAAHKAGLELIREGKRAGESAGRPSSYSEGKRAGESAGPELPTDDGGHGARDTGLEVVRPYRV